MAALAATGSAAHAIDSATAGLLTAHEAHMHRAVASQQALLKQLEQLSAGWCSL